MTGPIAGKLHAMHVEFEGVDSSTETFEAVFSREYTNMVGLAFLILNSSELAEEAVQDAFARLLDRYGSVRNPGGFLRTATLNRCRDLIRRQGRERNIMNRFRKVPELADSPETVASDLHDVLSALDQRKREVVVLRYYLDYSHAEIGAALGMKEPTVRTVLHRALKELRRELT